MDLKGRLLDDLIRDLKLADSEFNFNYKRRSIPFYLSRALFSENEEERKVWRGVLNNNLDKHLIRGYAENGFCLCRGILQ